MELPLDEQQLGTMIAPYNPWWGGEAALAAWQRGLPDYRRPVVGAVVADLAELPQMVSLTGPRRVGKTTALMHVAEHLVRQQGVSPERILYFSFDDPEVHGAEEVQRVVFDRLVERIGASGQVSYAFLDEIQRLPRWELFLKKYYDLKAPTCWRIPGKRST
jgi:predicted AAA+ superfamily ATPase